MTNLLSDGRAAPVRPGVRLFFNRTILRRLLSVAVIMASLAILTISKGAGAADGDLQRALLEAGCVKADIKLLPRKGQASIYEANCFGSSHKVIGVVCIDGRCVASQSLIERDELSD